VYGDGWRWHLDEYLMTFYGILMVFNWYDLAARQRNAISATQLDAAGVSRTERRRLLQQGVLHAAGRGVFIIGDAEAGWGTQLWCAVLAGGPDAVAFRRFAAAWWGMDGADAGIIEVAVPPGRQSRVAHVHRVTPLPQSDLGTHLGLPLTTVGRTLADLGVVVGPEIVERSLEWALRNGYASLESLRAIVDTRSGIGVRRLAGVLGTRPPGAPPTESDAETLFVQLVRQGGLPDPIRQYRLRLRGRLVRLDFAWPVLRLAVEIDGAATHGRDELPADLRRQNRILLDGWFILRYPWNLVAHDWRRVIGELREAWELRSVMM
jgi:very-short-patch-repair endonuclease